jgi:hypothetical protein
MAVQFYDRSRFHLETTHVDKNTGGGILVDTLGGLYECPAESSPAPEIDTKVEQPALAPVAPPPPPPTEPLVPM